uniref:Variant surface glycoprotein 1125.5011 n=1 Tax=Trypanosoma brucei TaxID=5691 RepID=A0A1J0RBK1_9TRYP|nr:variant surface glycoprotein 1125.5011 [Trypanosoma brucei]
MAFKTLAIVTENDVPNLLQQGREQQKRYTTTAKLLKVQEAAMLSQRKSAKPIITTSTATVTAADEAIGQTTSMATCTADVTISASETNCTYEKQKDEIKTANVDFESATKIKIAELYSSKPGFSVKACAKGTVADATAPPTHKAGGCIVGGSDSGGANRNDGIAAELTAKAASHREGEVSFFAEGSNSNCTQVDSNQGHTELKTKTLANALCELKKAPELAYTEPHNQAISSIENNDKLVRVLTDLTNPGAAPPTESQKKKELFNKYFGADAAAFKAEITDAVIEKNIDVTIRKKEIKKTAFELAGTDEGLTVLSYLQGKELAEKKQSQDAVAIPESTKESSDKCKAISDKDKCNNKDGCEYKGGKCKLKIGVKSENDAKTTNTTGSNSFVINKAPLLLAVLLL